MVRKSKREDEFDSRVIEFAIVGHATHPELRRTRAWIVAEPSLGHFQSVVIRIVTELPLDVQPLPVAVTVSVCVPTVCASALKITE
jgi:hypothetical protein